MDEIVREVPSTLKRLVRMVMRGFYNIEQVILMDMLIRNPCMKEDDLVDLLKFERKQLRAVIAQLKNDRFVKVRLRMETGPDGKTSRQNYYYINYKVFVNVVKYKLDHMRRKIETEERDSTSRASFKCTSCEKTFTDLEADQLIDFETGEFRCSYCNALVDEDQTALPKQDSRLLLARFNDQIEPLYDLLRKVEDIKLAPELLEPEPTDVSDIKRDAGNLPKTKSLHKPQDHDSWSGDATRNRNYHLNEEQGITINFGDKESTSGQIEQTVERKETPVWLYKSTVIEEKPSSVLQDKPTVENTSPYITNMSSQSHDIMEALLVHEKKGGASQPIIPGQGSGEESDTSESEDEFKAIMETTNRTG
ncbi:general transcription factor IIE subunit 1-like [Centruroides sculpturatus]|uniref:general transcription factor IIE subunit 1-like n=1 Tax=Centruroides sculpturatus TaxID=218467 RepID=UPI000C6CE3A2|nr:general transcription factor IIE subunit 1-like [Centruroides sculpturatus]